MQQEQIQELSSLIDLQILTAQESFSFTQALEPPVDPLDGIDGIDRAFATQDAETWLDNMINNDSE